MLFRWQIGKWGPCALASDVQSVEQDGRNCVGVRTRLISCVVHSATATRDTALEHCMKVSVVVQKCDIVCASL